MNKSSNKNFWKNEKTIFIFQTIGIFFITIFILAIFGVLPENLIPGELSFSKKDNSAEKVDYSKSGSVDDPNSLKEVTYVRDRDGRILKSQDNDLAESNYSTATKPTRVEISSVGIDTQVLEPSSVLVDVLDQFLQRGAVYYPGSGTIDQGNIFIFGHSTNWPVVQNQAYKTFNNLEDVKVGDEIVLTANGKRYVYEALSVELADADNAFIDLSRSGRRLTISTCNTFGKKSDRWVVDAVFKEVR